MDLVSFFDGSFNPVYNLSPAGWAHAVHVTSNGRHIVVGYGDDHVDLYENRDAKKTDTGPFKVTREMWEELMFRIEKLERG